MNPEIRFIYHADCAGLGGYLKLPFRELVPVQAAAALPISGGFSSSQVPKFNFRDVITTGTISSEATGSYSASKDEYGTVATTRIENLNILNMVTADLVVARLSASYPANTPTGAPVEPEIIPLGSQFVNLRIAGKSIDFEFDVDEATEHRTFSALCAKADKDPYGAVTTSLVKNVRDGRPGIECKKNVIKVPKFGAIILGELMATPNSRRLTMIHVDLGCAFEGTVTACSTQTNGGPSRPPVGH